MRTVSVIVAVLIAGCASTSEPVKKLEIQRITQAEAKSMACPAHILETGATETDCDCVSKELYALGQKQGALSSQNVFSHEASKGGNAGREVAIGVLRLTAFESCGLFDPDHPVSQNLGRGGAKLSHQNK